MLPMVVFPEPVTPITTMTIRISLSVRSEERTMLTPCSRSSKNGDQCQRSKRITSSATRTATTNSSTNMRRSLNCEDHELVKFAGGLQFFADQRFVIFDADLGGNQPVDARIVRVADEFYGRTRSAPLNP